MIKIYSVHYNSIASETPDYLYVVCGEHMANPDIYYRNYASFYGKYLRTIEEGELYKQQCLTKFKRKFINALEPNTWYQFILTKEQIDFFEEDCNNHGFLKYLVYQSPQLAINSNYPEDGPRLKVYLFHYKPE
jgi:hypothetical protein